MMIVPSLESERLCCSPSIHCNTSEHRRSSIQRSAHSAGCSVVQIPAAGLDSVS